MGYHHRQKTLIFPVCLSVGIVSLIITIIIILVAMAHEAWHLWYSLFGCLYGLMIGVLSFGFRYLDISDDEQNSELIIQFGYNLPCFFGFNKIHIPYDLIIQYQPIQSKWYFPRGCRKCGPTLFFNASGYGHCCKQNGDDDMIYLEVQERNKIHCCIREIVFSTNDRDNLMELLNSKDIRMLQVKDDGDNNNDSKEQELEIIDTADVDMP